MGVSSFALASWLTLDVVLCSAVGLVLDCSLVVELLPWASCDVLLRVLPLVLALALLALLPAPLSLLVRSLALLPLSLALLLPMLPLLLFLLLRLSCWPLLDSVATIELAVVTLLAALLASSLSCSEATAKSFAVGLALEIAVVSVGAIAVAALLWVELANLLPLGAALENWDCGAQ